eukprot:6329538-Alexandrium_andersonii.AAC.1
MRQSGRAVRRRGRWAGGGPAPLPGHVHRGRHGGQSPRPDKAAAPRAQAGAPRGSYELQRPVSYTHLTLPTICSV